MSNRITMTKALAAASANNIALTQTPTSGTALTLNGSTVSGGVATLDSARRVLLTFGNEVSARTLVLTGTNETGITIQETLAVASGGGSTVASVQDYLTITSAVPAGGGWSAAVTLGTNTTGSTPWKIVSGNVVPVEIGLNLFLSTGSATFGIEYTYYPVASGGNPPWSYFTPPAQVISHPTLSGLTASAEGSISGGIIPNAWRMTISSGTGTIVVSGKQAGFNVA